MKLAEIVFVRHGESEGNVAREEAEGRGDDVIDIAWRDPDAPLSEHGEEQARALGSWLAELPDQQRPVQIWSSPYVRAHDTAVIAVETAGLPVPVRLDERLRDRELGVLDRLTSRGVRSRFAGEAERRRILGKLYYRPPGGESWADVALRLRSFLQDLEFRADGRGPVLIAAHDAVILLFRYILEDLDEAALMKLAAQDSVGNASVTRLVRDQSQQWHVVDFGNIEHLEKRDVQPTTHGADHHAQPS